jgi:hypothetical protein
MMTGRSVQWMIGCTDTRKACDVGEFPDAGICNFGYPIAVLIIMKVRVQDSTPGTNFYKGAKRSVGDQTSMMNDRVSW